MTDADSFLAALALAPPAPVQLCPELWAHQAPDVFSVWSASEQADGVSAKRVAAPPFWAAVWPGAALLARVLLDEPSRVAGQRVWDLGCGGGVAAIAACRAGALQVTANDIDAFALRATTANAQLNQVQLDVAHTDLQTELEQFSHGDTLLVAEMFYERDAARALEDGLRKACSRGVRVLIADGERPFTPNAGRQLLREARLAVPFSLEGVHSRATRVFEWGPG
jgi:predicted nicotinamide N-methyase